MPTQNKYELRSQEVQEVLSTPPRFLTFWGNVLVVVVLATGLFFLSRYRVAQTIWVPVRTIEVNGNTALVVDTSFAEQIKVQQKLKIETRPGNITIEGTITEIIDTTISNSSKLVLLLTEISSGNFTDKTALSRGMNGEAKIRISEQSLLDLFISK